MSLFRTRLGYNGVVHEAHAPWQVLGNGYRIYNPTLMRFHSPDSVSPFGRGGINAYAYCAGDPINCVDPSGHFLAHFSLLLGVSAGIVGGTALASHFSGDEQAALIMTAVAGALAVASATAFIYRVHMKMPALKQGEIRIHRGSTRDVVDVHGDGNGVTVGGRSMSGTEFGAYLKSEGLGAKPITLASCGMAAQGQAVASAVGAPVTAYSGSAWLWGRSRVLAFDRPVMFTPLPSRGPTVQRIRSIRVDRPRGSGIGRQQRLRADRGWIPR